MRRVLVVRIGRLGDTILATPVIGALQKAYGAGVLIDFAASAGASSSILQMDTRINRVFPVTRRRTPWRVHRVKRELERSSRQDPYDLVINLECGGECDDFSRFVHYKAFCGRPLVQPRHQPHRHCVDTEKTIYAQLLGPDVTAAAEPSLKLNLGPQDLPVSPGADYVVINPGFSGIQETGYRSHRGWPDKHWRKLVELLNGSAGCSVLVNGTSDEQVVFASLLQLPGVYSLFGSSLPVLANALVSAKGLITVDTGTMHLATALGTSVLALFGPSNPALTGPYSRGVPNRVLVSGVDCQPCIKTPAQKQCSFNRCMAELGPVQVFEAFQQLLKA